MPTVFTNMAQLPKSEFAQAVSAVAAERGIDPLVILESIKVAILAAYKKDARDGSEAELEEEQFEVEINQDTGEARIFLFKKDQEREDVTPPGFGRIAAQTAKQVIHQKIREAEREAVLSGYEERIGQLVSGVILRFDGQNVRVDIGKAEAVMPDKERIPGERLESGQRLTFLLKEIREGQRGREIVVSRSDSLFIQKLFEREVPELASKSVEIRSIAREPGVRTKIAVGSRVSGVDPAGSCIGQKGVRVQAVINEAGGEKIDVIPWMEDPKEMIIAALSPAQGISVVIDKDKKRTRVTAPQDQLALVIGKDGQNVRLAAELTGYVIDVKGSGVAIEKIEKK